MEVFAKPAAGAIIETTLDGIDCILIQERQKVDSTAENGILEIPAGKIREFESIFDTLRREIWEETGLDITEIQGEKEADFCRCNGYEVISFEPFYTTQNLCGGYSILLQTFLCKAQGELLVQSDESVNIRWVSIAELSELLQKNESAFYPMHLNALRKYVTLKSNW